MSPGLLEREFTDQVKDLAAILGWETAHFRPAMTRHGWRTPVEGSLGKGWPDWIFVRERDRRLIFAELKAEGGKPTPDQLRVLDVLHALASTWPQGPRVEVHCWWPRDIERIAQVLR